MQKMRQHQRYLTKLQKISQTSSPSKQQQSPIEPASLKSRVNPASLTSSYLKFKRFEDQKDKKSSFHQQSNKAQCCQANYCYEKHQLQSTKKTQTIEQKNHKISFLQESIVRKKMQLTLLQECFQKRSNSWRKDKFNAIFINLFESILKLCQISQKGRKSYMNMVLKYSKQRKTNPQNSLRILVEWVLKIVKQLFSVLSSLLKIPTSSSE